MSFVRRAIVNYLGLGLTFCIREWYTVGDKALTTAVEDVFEHFGVQAYDYIPLFSR